MVYNGKVRALDGINFTVEKGEWVAIMGSSGSGKTTLMNIIGCMDKATGSEVILDGYPVLILADEPTGNLDEANQNLARRWQRGSTLHCLGTWEN